ncbi:hypothetical protein BLA24_30940 [Streptomyces cinnamoneus]|uniref:Uncharacterized protein n=1 Tax=Streptomyces cinnamoneus TaxID=53446 RepID=A0A2G1X9L7_STRCJ|nr:hypothetical protein [Streptomyces cinnamoneus]PHQ47918.1 hypothetical protein BLA24_30940 [Streptomyces cinnamoneus]PPT15543.1 hypothetical protein CYQ11_24040 [Streptomyces cinnamoneus]
MTAPDEPQATERTTDVGALVVDARRDRVGEVVGSAGGRLLLRSPSDGQEWEAFPCDVRPATVSDELRAKVADINHRSRRERGWA